MSEPKWTPGPWRVAENPYNTKPDDPCSGAIKIEGDVESNWQVPPLVCATYRGCGDLECARLIAAAPDLYAALAAFVKAGDGHDDFTDEWPAARAALAKARGEG